MVAVRSSTRVQVSPRAHYTPLPSKDERRNISDVEAISLAEAYAEEEGLRYKPVREAIRHNLKTGMSFECTTICPKHIRGVACKYCYVREAQERVRHTKTKPHAVMACDYTVYNEGKDPDEVKPVRMWSQEKINKMNAVGGLRLFSDADFVKTPQCHRALRELITESKERGLKLKAITKRTDFVRAYNEDIDTINVSVDTLGSGVRWKEAQELRDKYPNVKIRAVALNRKEAKDWCAKPWVDVVTLYHGGVHTYNLDMSDPDIKRDVERRRAEDETVEDTVTTENMLTKSTKVLDYMESIGCTDRTCCIGGRCNVCRLKCAGGKCTKMEVDNDMKGALMAPERLVPLTATARFHETATSVLDDLLSMKVYRQKGGQGHGTT